MEPIFFKKITMGGHTDKMKRILLDMLDRAQQRYGRTLDIRIIRDVLLNLSIHLNRSHPFNLSDIKHIIAPKGEKLEDFSLPAYYPFDSFFMEDYAIYEDNETVPKEDRSTNAFALFIRNPHLVTKCIEHQEVIEVFKNSKFDLLKPLEETSELDFWVAVQGTRTTHILFPYNVFCFWSINKEIVMEKKGFVVSCPFASLDAAEHPDDSMLDMQMQDICGEIGSFYNFCQFLSIKNIHIADSKFTLNERQKRLAKHCGFKYHTLVVGKPSKQYDSTKSNESQGIMPLHVCRGHIARYTEEKPLFGKYVGTFYIPAHVRGSMKVGTVTKSYSLKGK